MRQASPRSPGWAARSDLAVLVACPFGTEDAVTVAMPAGNNLGFAEPFALGRATASAMTVGTASFELE
jgi:hypothetical protein